MDYYWPPSLLVGVPPCNHQEKNLQEKKWVPQEAGAFPKKVPSTVAPLQQQQQQQHGPPGTTTSSAPLLGPPRVEPLRTARMLFPVAKKKPVRWVEGGLRPDHPPPLHIGWQAWPSHAASSQVGKK